MLINLSELFTRKGMEKSYQPEIEMDTLHSPQGDYKITEKGPSALHIRNVGDRTLYLEGSFSLVLDIPCSRCLTPVRNEFHLAVDRSLDMNQTDEDRINDLDEQPYVEGYYLDVDQLVRNELLLNLPMKVLCREDCKGICDRCGANLNQGSCGCDDIPSDPRMAAIQDIFKQFKEV